MRRTECLLWATAVAMVLALAVPAAATEPPASAGETVPVSWAGMVVHIDAATGELRAPTAEEAAELREAVRRQFGSPGERDFVPEQRDLAGGGVMSELDVELHDFLVVRVTDEGETVTACVKGETGAANFLAETPAVPNSSEESER